MHKEVLQAHRIALTRTIPLPTTEIVQQATHADTGSSAAMTKRAAMGTGQYAGPNSQNTETMRVAFAKPRTEREITEFVSDNKIAFLVQAGQSTGRHYEDPEQGDIEVVNKAVHRKEKPGRSYTGQKRRRQSSSLLTSRPSNRRSITIGKYD